jgi:hypothetical protein
MLRISTLWKVLSLCLLAHASLASAQQSSGAAPLSAPPKLERIDEGSDTPITVVPPKSGDRKIKEKKEGGQVTEVQVQSGKSNYTMKPNVPAGNAQPGDGTSSAIRAPQWQVLEFDLSKKKKTDREEGPDAEKAPVPPPPTAK